MLGNFFQNGGIFMGQVFDTSGFRRWAGEQWLGDNLNPERYSFEPPMGGGLRIVGSVTRAGGGLLSRASSALGRLFGKGGTSEAAKRTIQVVQREGNLVEMVGTGARGEIRVLTEMTRQGDAIVLKGLHMEGASPGAIGIRELHEFARQLGKEQGVNRVIVEGAKRTTGANPGHIPRTIEIKVN